MVYLLTFATEITHMQVNILYMQGHNQISGTRNTASQEDEDGSTGAKLGDDQSLRRLANIGEEWGWKDQI